MASNKHSRRRKMLLTLAVVGVIAGFLVFGTFAAFTATTTNTGNQIDSGTVKIDQHTGATTLYNVTNQKPGDSKVSCVRVTYSGSLAASVKLYVSSGITNGTLYNLKVERGSGLTAPAADMNCTGFSATSTPFNTTLGTFPTTYAAGIDGKAGGAAWNASDAVDYRFTITQNDDTTANAHTSVTSSGGHTFTWEAQNN
jgi:hypothetical protein